MGRCWGGRGILEEGQEDWIVWENTAGNGVAQGEGGRAFLRPDEQRGTLLDLDTRHLRFGMRAI
jgi:hypothetical protein